MSKPNFIEAKPALPLRLVDGVLNAWQRSTCSHRWVRARFPDSSYGLRCSVCMKAYPRTWNDLMNAAAPAPVSPHLVSVDALERVA